MVQRHGQDHDWRNQPIDPQAGYASAGGQAHGRWEYLIWSSKLFSYACDWTESMVYSTKCMVHSCRMGIFDSTIDSRELRHHGRQSTSSSSQSSRSRSSAQEIEIAVLRQHAEYHESILRETNGVSEATSWVPEEEVRCWRENPLAGWQNAPALVLIWGGGLSVLPVRCIRDEHKNTRGFIVVQAAGA